MSDYQFTGLPSLPLDGPIEMAPPVEPVLRTSDAPDLASLSTPEGLKRYLDIAAVQVALDVDRQISFGSDSEPVTWAQAEAVYERMQAEGEHGG